MESDSGASETAEAPEKIGGPSRTRTLDPLIKRDPEEDPEQTQDELVRENPNDCSGARAS